MAGYAALGEAGINLEDSTYGQLIPAGAHAAKVTAIKRRCPDLLVNVRLDNFWLGQDATVEAVLSRGAQYVAAGADGVLVPGADRPDVIASPDLQARLVRAQQTGGNQPADCAEWRVYDLWRRAGPIVRLGKGNVIRGRAMRAWTER